MTRPTAKSIRQQLERIADPVYAKEALRFFKCGPGEYGEGDKLIGIRVPQLRELAKANRGLAERGVLSLLKSPIHEERLLALFIMTWQFEKGDDDCKSRIFDLYCRHTKWINNWDLVDSSAYKIVGPFLQERDHDVLYEFAQSKDLWERRIAIMSTFAFIRNGDFSDTLKIANLLLQDKEDLIHKAVGWMLREVGKRDPAVEARFLKSRYKKMPRTMLRYATEHMPAEQRNRYLKAKV